MIFIGKSAGGDIALVNSVKVCRTFIVDSMSVKLSYAGYLLLAERRQLAVAATSLTCLRPIVDENAQPYRSLVQLIVAYHIMYRPRPPTAAGTETFSP